MSWVWGRSAPPWIWLTGAHLAVGAQNRKVAPSSCRFLGCLELPRALPLHWQSMASSLPRAYHRRHQRGAARRRAQLMPHSIAAIPAAQVFALVCKPIHALGSAGVAPLKLDLWGSCGRSGTPLGECIIVDGWPIEEARAAGGAQSAAWRAASPPKPTPRPPMPRRSPGKGTMMGSRRASALLLLGLMAAGLAAGAPIGRRALLGQGAQMLEGLAAVAASVDAALQQACSRDR